MSAIGSDAALVGSIPELYQTLLVPLIFQPYAAVLASRVADIAVISPLCFLARPPIPAFQGLLLSEALSLSRASAFGGKHGSMYSP